MKGNSKLCHFGFILASLAAVPMFAQTSSNPNGTNPNNTNPPPSSSYGPGSDTTGTTPNSINTYGNNTTGSRHDFGWLGLIGLIGLAGLRRGSRRTDVETTDRTNLGTGRM